jgi:serine/threonine-protein kinase
MATSIEVQALQWFERALARPPAGRADWLAAQDLAPALRSRIQALLDEDGAAATVVQEAATTPDEVPAEFPKVGDRLGAWELLKPLEAGGMGVVYLGRRADDVYEKQVAIKLVRPVHLLAAADFRRQLITRFEEERSILARMSHPNVARILDGGSTAAGVPYLVMEFVEGVSLTEFCKQRKLDVLARLALFCKVCDGVQEAHRHLVVHRDLKPDNILVGEDGEPRLLDFGIAKILEQEPLEAGGKRQTSLSAMTPAYASPEQVRQQALTTSSDVYSLGVMLYQLIAGVRPYELAGLRPAEAEHRVCEVAPEPMRRMLHKAVLTDAERQRRRGQVTQDVERIVAKAMHKEPARRYGSAQELADDIRRYLAGQPVQAHPDSTAYRMRKFVRRNRWGVLAASVALVAVLASAGVALWQAKVARQAAADTARINQFLSSVLAYSDPYVSGGQPTLGEAIDSSVRLVDDVFEGRPDLRAKVRQVLGASLLGRGQFVPAREQLGLALDEATAAEGAGSLRAMEIRQALLQVMNAEGRTDEAADGMQRLLEDLLAAGHRDTGVHFAALANLAELRLQQERYDDAIALISQARALPPAVLDEVPPDSLAILRSNEALATHAQGRHAEALRLFDEAEAMHRALRPNGSPDLWALLGNRAFLLADMGRGEEAFALRHQVLDEQRARLGADSPLLVSPLIGLAIGSLEQGDPAQASALLREAVGISRANLPQPHVDTAVLEGMLARTLRDAGDLVAAEDMLAQAETRAAGVEPTPQETLEGLGIQRRRICDRAKALALPRCAGVPPPPAD